MTEEHASTWADYVKNQIHAGSSPEKMGSDIERAIRQAVLEEREACAVTAETSPQREDFGTPPTHEFIAQEIRGRPLP